MSSSLRIELTPSSQISMLRNTFQVYGFRCYLIANSSTTCQYHVLKSLLKTPSALSFTTRFMICSVLTWKATRYICRTMVATYRTSPATTGISLSIHAMSLSNTQARQTASQMLKCAHKWMNSLWRQRQAHSSSPRKLTSTTIMRLMSSSQRSGLSSRKALPCTITTLFRKLLMYSAIWYTIMMNYSVM